MSQQVKTEYNDICELVRQAESDYISGQTQTSKYVSVSQYETLNKIDAYLGSTHTSGATDSLDREKPFFNISIAAVNIWYRATQVLRKNIKVKATKGEQDIAAFLATVHLQNWMRGTKNNPKNFGQFLTKWGRSLAKYGSSVVKFVEQKGELHALVIPWSRLIVDTIDFDSNPVIEILELTPTQLRKNKAYDQEMVEKLIDAVSARTNLENQSKDTRHNYIKLYEVHGEISLSYLTGKTQDENKDEQQMHVISFVESKEDGEFDDFTLYSGKETQTPYMITHLIEEDDQTLSVGAVQNLFDAQWMVNHTMKQIKDQLDLASKLIFQTSDGNFVGQNALSSIKNGDILIHAVNQPLTQVVNSSHDITTNQAFSAQWQTLGNQINGISESMLGLNPKAGSAWRQTQALLQESHSLFEVMTQNKGLYVEQMLRQYIIPFLKKKMDTSEEISATLDSYHIDKIDAMYVPNEAIRRHNAVSTEAVLNGQDVPDFNAQQGMSQVKSELNQQGNQRFFKPSEISSKTWKNLFKDLEWEIEVDITGEQKDTQAVMETLQTALKAITMATPEMLANPNFKLVFNKILEESAVISPIEISAIPPTPPPAPVNKVSESMSYKDTPADVQRQIEAQAGLQPSKLTTPVVQPTEAVPAQ